MTNSTLKEYFLRIYRARYFLLHLVRWDMKYKFRRSKLGMLWTILQPLLLTMIMSTVFSYAFHQDMKTYAPYILSGTLVWDIIQSSFIGNSSSFVAAEAYIRQYAHPLALYPLRAAMVSLSTFSIAFTSLLVWTLILYPQNMVLSLLSLPLTFCIYFLFSWAISIISSHIFVRYRDYPYIMTLVMQFLWYLSPVFFREEMFEANELLYGVFLLNPITQVLKLIRTPLFQGQLAGWDTYFYVFVLACAFLFCAWKINQACEKTVIYYL